MSYPHKSTLYITYDGLLDPLGGSQILPYLFCIASHPRPLHVISFEKQSRYDSGAEKLREELSARGIGWTTLSFTTRLGKLGKMWDLLRMYSAALKLHFEHRFDVVHCRSYQAMQVGVLLRSLSNTKTIFDMRGLWVDERVDGGLWPQDLRLNRLSYKYYKRVERYLLLKSDHIVALTDRVVIELKKISPKMAAPVTVIPCCADFNFFEISDELLRSSRRAAISIPSDALVIAYLGSLGTWYMLEEMLELFFRCAMRRDDVHFLFITRDWRSEHDALLVTMGMSHLRDRIHVHSATRDQVPGLLGVADVMVSFIKPVYSKIASSPTKLAEAFALGIPVISNVGIGDVAKITHELDAGAVVDLGVPGAVDNVVTALDVICTKGGVGLRGRARLRFGLEVAERSYHQVYETVEALP